MLQARTWTQTFLFSLIHIQLSKKLCLALFQNISGMCHFLWPSLPPPYPVHHYSSPGFLPIVANLVSDSIPSPFRLFSTQLPEWSFEVEIRTCQLSATHLLRLPISQKEKPESYPGPHPQRLRSGSCDTVPVFTTTLMLLKHTCFKVRSNLLWYQTPTGLLLIPGPQSNVTVRKSCFFWPPYYKYN